MKRSNSSAKRSSRKLIVESLENRAVMAGDCLHNFVMPEDADASGSVTPLDALVVINRINQSISGRNSGSDPANALSDVDADAAITPLDALVVIDHLNGQSAHLANGPRASRVQAERRIQRIEQAIASNSLPAHFTIDDAYATLDTLRAGGRPELGDHVLNGALQWKQEDASSPEEPENPSDDSESTPEQIDRKRLENFVASLSNRLEAFNVSSDVIATISSEMIQAYQAGAPMDLIQIRVRLAELGVDVNKILPQAVRPERPELPERPDLPERPELPERPIMPAVMVTEPIAESIIARLKNAGINAELIDTVSNEIWGSIKAGTPMDLQQLRVRLGELGIDWERLHAPPSISLPVIRPPRTQGLEALKRVLPQLGRIGINRTVITTIYAEAQAAAAAGKPMSVEQVVARLKQLGVSLDGTNFSAI